MGLKSSKFAVPSHSQTSRTGDVQSMSDTKEGTKFAGKQTLEKAHSVTTSATKEHEDKTTTVKIPKPGSSSTKVSKDKKWKKPKDEGSKSILPKDPAVVAQAKKRASLRDGFPVMDPITDKERQKLVSPDSILPMGGTVFTHAMLKLHNSYRADHGVPNVGMSCELNQLAQTRAEALIQSGTRGLPPDVGENVFTTSSDLEHVAGASQACREWYYHHSEADFDCPRRFSRRCIYFLNLIWEKTEEIGSGRAVSGTGKVAIISLYKPKLILDEVNRDVCKSLAERYLEDQARKDEHVKTQ